MSHQINIVYYVWINPLRNWEVIVRGQLTDVVQSGILSKSKLYIVVCCEETFVNAVKELIRDICDSASVDFVTSGNFFEFPGILKIYELALQEPDKTFLYFHTKGMFQWYFTYNKENERMDTEVFLTRKMLESYPVILNVFAGSEEVSKACLFPGKGDDFGNACLLNFWWAKGNYLNSCERPTIMTDRFYYERWIGTGSKDTKTFNLIDKNITSSYTNFEANSIMWNIIMSTKGKDPIFETASNYFISK
jgi:hypothetical protein